MANHLTLDELAAEFDMEADELRDICVTGHVPLIQKVPGEEPRACIGLVGPVVEKHLKEQRRLKENEAQFQLSA